MGEVHPWLHGSQDWLAIALAEALQDVQHVLALGEGNGVILAIPGDMNAQEI